MANTRGVQSHATHAPPRKTRFAHPAPDTNCGCMYLNTVSVAPSCVPTPGLGPDIAGLIGRLLFKVL